MPCWDDSKVTTAIQQIPIQTIDGSAATLGDYQGDVLLVVNVASKCGLTPQYEALERVYEEFRDRGFAVLGFPATMQPIFPALHNGGTRVNGVHADLLPFGVLKGEKPY